MRRHHLHHGRCVARGLHDHMVVVRQRPGERLKVGRASCQHGRAGRACAVSITASANTRCMSIPTTLTGLPPLPRG
jgi:hypothetical protein